MALRTLFSMMWLLSVAPMLWAQQGVVRDTIDEKYREDQFYVGITYNLISDVPDNVNLKGVTGGLHFGFIRDMPINAQRNWAIGLGIGMSLDQYGQNLLITEDEDKNTIFRVINDDVINFKANRFSTYTVEVPLELRWRTSAPNIYQFWRVYAGLRVGYSYWYQSKFLSDNANITQRDIDEFGPWRFTANISAGYGPFNVFFSYALNPFFTDARIQQTQEEFGFRPMKLGIIFYIL